MKTLDLVSGCACCNLNRRRFLAAGCTACVGAAGLMTSTSSVRAADAATSPKIRIIYSLHAPQQARPDWPNVGFDFQPVMSRIDKELAERCPNIQFVSTMATGAEQAQKIVDEDKAGSIDGYVVYQLNCWNPVVQTIAATGKPVLYADFQYGGSGGFLVYTAGFLRNKAPNVGYVASSRIEDVAEAVKCFELVKRGSSVEDFVKATARIRCERTPKAGDLAGAKDALVALSPEECLKQMKQAKILAVGGGWPGIALEIQNAMGIEVINVPFSEVNDAWKAADKDQSREVASRWAKTATEVRDVSPETLETSAAMYLGQKAVLQKHGAMAITINCLGGFYGGHIHAYPCLGFHELLNEGLVGACECDVRSTATMVAMTLLTQGRPGYISDPVIDASKRQIIYAHCVASNRVFGPKGDANPFQILTHSEDRQGASLRSVMPLGYLTTTVELRRNERRSCSTRARPLRMTPTIVPAAPNWPPSPSATSRSCSPNGIAGAGTESPTTATSSSPCLGWPKPSAGKSPRKRKGNRPTADAPRNSHRQTPTSWPRG